MAEMILPGVYIDVRAEALIAPKQVTVGTIGAVGTARRGPVGAPVTLASSADARATFGGYDPWDPDPANADKNLTLVRALELAYGNGATTVVAVRVATSQAAPASLLLASATGSSAKLDATSPGLWGNDIAVDIKAGNDPKVTGAEPPFVTGEEHDAAPFKLAHVPVQNARNTVTIIRSGVSTRLTVRYDGSPAADEVKIDTTTGDLTFATAPGAGDRVIASYVARLADAVVVKVTYAPTRATERYTVLDGNQLIAKMNDPITGSAFVTATAGDHPQERPAPVSAHLSGGNDGAVGADYQKGLDVLLDEDAQIILAAGQDDRFAAELDGHCQSASTDAIKRDRIAVVGSQPLPKDQSTAFDLIRGNVRSSDRLVYVAPGITTPDRALSPPTDVLLPGAYAAAAVAGLIARLPAHFSPTNKSLDVDGLQFAFNAGQLAGLVQDNVFALELRQGVKVVRGITTDSGAFAQITTRRITDFAKYGVRSAADPYIGLLNNERVRGALRATINSFLAEMVNDEMLISYDLTVTATREQQRAGIAAVSMVLRPVFSIDFIKVTMFLE